MERSFFKTDISEAERLNQKLDAALKGIREEFDEHRESINDNTNEMQANYEYISRVDEKISKVEEQLSQLQNWLSRVAGLPQFETQQKEIELTEKEKEVFLILYTASDEKPLSYQQIAEATEESDFLVKGYVTNMIEKGVPIQKRYVDGKVYLSLEQDFKELQAKNKIVKLSQKTVSEFLR